MKYSKLAQKEYKSKPDWVGKVIYEESRKRLKFDRAFEWQVYKPVPTLKMKRIKLSGTMRCKQTTKSGLKGIEN